MTAAISSASARCCSTPHPSAPWPNVDDITAHLHFRGTELVEVVGERPGAGAWRVEPDSTGGVRETLWMRGC